MQQETQDMWGVNLRINTSYKQRDCGVYKPITGRNFNASQATMKQRDCGVYEPKRGETSTCRNPHTSIRFRNTSM